MKFPLSVIYFFALLLGASPAAAQISGTVEYTGTESGKIFVEAFTDEDATFEKRSTSMINPGPFSFENLEEGNYNVVSFIDANDNQRIDAGEVWTDAGDPIGVPPGASNVVLDLDSYVPPADDDGESEEESDEGCCRVVASPRTPIALLVVLIVVAATRVRPTGRLLDTERV